MRNKSCLTVWAEPISPLEQYSPSIENSLPKWAGVLKTFNAIRYREQIFPNISVDLELLTC